MKDGLAWRALTARKVSNPVLQRLQRRNGEKSRHERNFEDKYKCLVPPRGAIFLEFAQGAEVGFNQEDRLGSINSQNN